jgi:aspartyl-tRNA(Asn)/glutamyl-tRNA(Gln) amidotransferase subunit C
MNIDDKLIKRLERLARIDLSQDERTALSSDLSRIISFVESLRSVDTTGAGAAPVVGHFDKEHVREDEPAPGLDRDELLDQAVDTADGFFRVPPVIERGDEE